MRDRGRTSQEQVLSVTNPKVATATNPGETGEGLARPKHDTRGEALMMTAISTIASVLLPTF